MRTNAELIADGRRFSKYADQASPAPYLLVKLLTDALEATEARAALVESQFDQIAALSNDAVEQSRAFLAERNSALALVERIREELDGDATAYDIAKMLRKVPPATSGPTNE